MKIGDLVVWWNIPYIGVVMEDRQGRFWFIGLTMGMCHGKMAVIYER